MPDDALPVARPDAGIPGLVSHRRSYIDVLGRPMTGTARITGARQAIHGDAVVTSAPVTVPVEGGVLSVSLPPGEYEVSASLTSVDQEQVGVTETITLAATQSD